MNIVYFWIMSFVYVISPGPAVLVVVNKGVNQHLHNVFYFLLGNSSGLLVLAVVSSMGFLLFPNMYTYMNVFAVGYFFYMGIKLGFATISHTVKPVHTARSYTEGYP